MLGGLGGSVVAESVLANVEQVGEVILHSPNSSHSSSSSTVVAHQGLPFVDSMVVQADNFWPELNLKGKTQGLPSIVKQGLWAGTSVRNTRPSNTNNHQDVAPIISQSFQTRAETRPTPDRLILKETVTNSDQHNTH